MDLLKVVEIQTDHNEQWWVIRESYCGLAIRISLLPAARVGWGFHGSFEYRVEMNLLLVLLRLHAFHPGYAMLLLALTGLLEPS